MSNYKIGEKYVVEMQDERHVKVIRELSKRERFIYDIHFYILNLLKVIVILLSLVCPPLLMFLFKYNLKNKMEKK